MNAKCKDRIQLRLMFWFTRSLFTSTNERRIRKDIKSTKLAMTIYETKIKSIYIDIYFVFDLDL